MSEVNKIFQAKFVGLIEISEPLNEESRYSIALEDCQVKRLDVKKLAEDEIERHTYSLENLGRCNILTEKEGKPYLLKAKAKKCTKSQVLRLMIEAKGLDYLSTMSKIIDNWESLIS